MAAQLCDYSKRPLNHILYMGELYENHISVKCIRVYIYMCVCVCVCVYIIYAATARSL